MVDPARNMAKFYTMVISPSLFGDVALVRSWGRMAKRGAFRINLFGSHGEAEVARAKIVAQKLARGYRVGAMPARPRANVGIQLDLFT
ncbi:WGR domain-containing protein [Mesorhizobium sp. SP-1A]|uniref:WGR domain-containing protein n=1 Tax=Mesorhizobium sp. SP-1A TaxID=3077840 RepID=UPI0028F6CD1E|nr:WGR domain-containing protein [Mesorhizobium sp. SP-1A]